MAGFKSDENKQLFIKGLREANFTQEEIDREVQDIEGAPVKAAPVDSAPPPAKKEDAVVSQPSPFALDTAAPARQLKEMGQSREEQGKTLVDNITPTGGFWPPSKENWPVYALPAAAAVVTATGLGLKSRFFGPEKEAGARVEPTSSDRLPAAAQQPTTHEQWIANLSPEEKNLYERSEEAKAARANALESTRIEPVLEPESPVVAPQTPEQIRQAKLAANAQAAQQSMVAAPPPESAPLQKVEPPTERPVNPKVPALLQPPMAGAVVPETVTGVPAEPVATPVAEPVATTTETPAAPVATDAERVQALKDLEEPATKTTNEKIVEAVTTPKETPKEEFVPRKWPGTSKGGAGAEGFALQQLGASRATYSKEHAAALEILKDRTNGILTQSPSGGGIHQQDQLSKMYEDYTGKPIPKTEKGGWARIPDSQVAELHAGILNELQEAAKGGKLKSLGKGALAAAALLGISEAVQAAQKGNFGPLKEAGFDIGIGVLGGPAVMAGQMALTGQTLASGMTPKGQKEFQNRQEILGREGVKDYLQMLKQLNPNPADYTKAAEQYLATNPNAPKTKSQRFNEQTQQIRTAQTQKEHSSRK
jgi:hypothetical protein